MRADWRASTWGQEISLEYGKAIRGYSTENGRYRVFGTNGAVGWTSDSLAPGPGVILGRKGAYRGVHFSKDPFWVIDTAYFVRPKTELDMRWTYYAVQHHKLGEIDDGSPIPSTTRAAVYVRDVEVPPIEVQRAIAHILGTLDDKIELNRQMAATLEEMARAIFKSWFIDFDPVHRNIAKRMANIPHASTGSWFVYAVECEDGSHHVGFTDDLHRGYEEHCAGRGADDTKPHRPVRLAYWEVASSKEEALERERKLKSESGREWLKKTIDLNWTPRRPAQPMPAGGQPQPDIDALFPDSFEDSELGEIPSGWETAKIRDLCDILVNGSTPSRGRAEFWEDGTIPWFRTGELLDSFLLEAGERITSAGHAGSSTKLLPRYSVVMAIYAAPTVGRLGITTRDATFNQAMTGMRARSEIGPWFLFENLYQLRQWFNDRANGAAQQNISKAIVEEAPVVVPRDSLLAHFNALVAPLYERREALEVQSKSLADVRDTLLPKLISGDLSVSEVKSANAQTQA